MASWAFCWGSCSSRSRASPSESRRAPSIGRSLGQHVDKQLIEDVEADLTADTSALFVVLTGNAAALVGALQPYAGKVYQTSLDAEVESQIEAALEKEG